MVLVNDLTVEIYFADLTDEAKEKLRSVGIEPDDQEAPLAIRPRGDHPTADSKI